VTFQITILVYFYLSLVISISLHVSEAYHKRLNVLGT